MWVVRAKSMTSERMYTYTIEAPKDADEVWVCMSAANEHGRRVRAGESDAEFTGPMRAEWQDEGED